jgi:hypothetical protein
MNDPIYPSERLQAIETRLARIEVALSGIARERNAGSVYIVTDGNGRYKIGKAADATERMKGLKTGNITASLVMAIETDNRHALERTLHRRYRDAGRHLGGEWYALCWQDIDMLALLPSPLFETELGRVAELPVIDMDQAAIPTVDSSNNGDHPGIADAGLLMGPEIVATLRGVKSSQGGKYQVAVKEIQQLLREGMNA